MQVSGQFSRSGFALQFFGDASFSRLQPLAADFAQLKPLRDFAPQGSAQVDLNFFAPWLPSIDPNTGADSQAAIVGSTRLENAQLHTSWLPEPVLIASATAQFTGASVTWTSTRASFNGIALRGSASYATTCADPAGCPAQLSLDFPALDAASLQSAILGAGRHDEFLEAILSRVEGPAPPWPALNAAIQAGTLTIGDLKLTKASASVTVRGRLVNLVSFDATTLGGTVHSTGSIQSATDGPQYAVNVDFNNLKLAAAGDIFHENWGPGNISGYTTLSLRGYSNLAASTTGSFYWTLRGGWGGNWTPTSPFHGHPTWLAAGTIANQTLTIHSVPAQGTIGFDRKLDLTWTNPAKKPARSKAGAAQRSTPAHITGTLAHPTISARASASHSPQP